MTTQHDYDVAIIGGGHNGLTAAAYLARADLSVVVLEKNDVVGGAAMTEEFHPGFRNSVAAYTVSLLNPKVIDDLKLSEHGLTVIERPVANFWPVDNSQALLLPYGSAARQRAISQFSKVDAAALPAYDAAIERAANLLRQLVLRTPPNAGGGLIAMLRAGKIARQLTSAPIEDQRLLVDLFTMSVADFLSHWFENDVVRGAFAFDGIVGAYAAPSTPGTAYVLLHHCFGEVNGKPGVWGHAVGGMGAISQAIACAAQKAGANIKLHVGVQEVLVEDGRACGVVLEDGDRISARAVACAVPPKLLFRDLIAAEHVEPELRNRYLNLKSGSGTFRMNIALRELPDFTCRPGKDIQDHHGAGIIIGPTLDYLEDAYENARRMGWSRKPVIEMLIPTTIDNSLAPKGAHVASLFVQHVAPHLPGERSWSSPHEKERFADLVIETLSEYAPNVKHAVLGRQILSPLDLEQRFGLVDGDIFHGQLCPQQLFSTRPVLGHADYRLGMPGLYLCGSGAHPGGGVTGVPGHNAAREIISDLRRLPWPGLSQLPV